MFLKSRSSLIQALDIDPESYSGGFEAVAESGSGEEEPRDENDGRDHYEAVGKSEIRQPERAVLGKEYRGSKVSRDQLMKGGEEDLQSESSDDPFAEQRHSQDQGDNDYNESDSAEEDDFADPNKVDLSIQHGEDEEIDSDEAFGEGDLETFKDFKFRASKPQYSKQRNGAVNGNGNIEDEASLADDLMDSESLVESDEDAVSLEDATDNVAFDSDGSKSIPGTDVSSEQEDPANNRAALKALMADERKSLVSTISDAVKSDVSKGKAVKHQHEAYNSLLTTRIRLQKALIATNSIVFNETPTPNTLSDQDVIEAAQTAALDLFNSLTALRASLPTGTAHSKKRSFSATLESSSEEIQTHLRSIDHTSSTRNRPTLTKWAQKTHMAASIPTQNKFSASTLQPLTSVLDGQLCGSNLNRLISRTRTPRNCAPLQSEAGREEDPAIYDDSDWYSLLLRDLVDSKMASSTNGAAAATYSLNGPTAQSVSALRRENKQHRKGVDVKASKGRKMRYTVHEKLQNFMAPDDRGTWESRQSEELFAGLLGRKVRGGLVEDLEGNSEDEVAETEGLRLFGGS